MESLRTKVYAVTNSKGAVVSLFTNEQSAINYKSFLEQLWNAKNYGLRVYEVYGNFSFPLTDK